MKKIALLAVLVLGLNSCYISNLYVGNMKEETPKVKIASVKNHIFLFGLIPGISTNHAIDKVGEQTDYMVKNKWEFIDGFLGVITCGIYTPTTTNFYAPYETK